MKLLLTTLAAFCLCFSATTTPIIESSDSDWPQWRGPERNGTSNETGLLKQWPAGGPKLLWQVNDIGDGYSTPVVVGSRIYLMSNRGMDNEFVQALSIVVHAAGRKQYVQFLSKGIVGVDAALHEKCPK